MNKYGYDIICCEELNREFIKKISILDYSNEKKKLLIQVRNTKYIDKKELLYLKRLKKIYNLDLKISVIGPYKIIDSYSEKKQEKYFYNTLYDLDELYEIITEFEKIESLIDPQWNEFDIVVFLAETITRNIMYDPEYWLMYKEGIEIPKVIGEQDESDYFHRSLRGVLTRKTVCAGFSVIFKELANRNGIECKFVSGKIRNSKRGGHAWNLVKINGVVYPIDITWKNSKYRCGDFANIEDISCDIKKFRKYHIPFDKCDDIGLTKIDEDIVRKAKKKTLIRKHYNLTTQIIERTNKSKFLLSQIGTYRGLYKYLYSEINQDGSYTTPIIVFSESNLLKEIDDHRFQKSNHYIEFKKSFVDVLFSKRNLYDSLINKDTNYIGKCELIGKDRYVESYREIRKSSKKIDAFRMINIKSQKRADGSIITLVQFPNKSDNNLAYAYCIYVLSQGPCVVQYNIYSNTDYFSLNSNLVINSILNDDNLRASLKHGGIIK